MRNVPQYILHRTVIFAVLASPPLMARAQDLAAQALQTCAAYPAPRIGFQSWDADANYDLYEQPSGERKSIRITGDILNISSQDFGSIVRELNNAPGNVDEIVFEAREINVLGTISFKGSRIVLLGDSITFGPEGSIYLDQPSAIPDGLYLAADTITFRQAMPRALQVPLGTEPSGRKIEVRARQLFDERTPLIGDAARDAMWRRSIDFEISRGVAIPGTFDVDVGTEGGKRADATISERATWPLFFAFKAQKFFSRAPFDEQNRVEVRDRISTTLPRVEALGNASAIALLTSTLGLMDLDLDAQGRTPFFVPRRDFVSSRVAFAARVAAAEGQLDTLMDIVASAYDRKPLDIGKIEKVRADYRAAAGDIAAREDQMTKALTEISVGEKRIVELNGQVEQRREVLTIQLDDLRQRNDDASRIKVATTVVAIGAAMIPSPAAPIIAATLSATGEMVYAHNTSPGGVSLETFATIASKSAAFYQAASEAQSAWNKHLGDLATTRDAFKGTAIKGGKVVSKMDALKASGSSGGAFADKIKGMYDKIQSLPDPTSIEMSGLEKEDRELQGLLSRIGAIRTYQAKLIDEVASLTQQLASDAAVQAAASVLESELLTMNPSNDRDIMRWKTTATALWRDFIEDMYLEAIMLRRSLYFETAKVPELPADLLQFPEEMTAYVRSGLYSPTGNFSTKDLTVDHLRREKAKHLAALRAIDASILRSFEAYQGERAGGAVPYTQTYAFSPDGSVAERAFLAQVNAQITSAMRSDGTVTSARIPIPIALSPAPLPSPERLVQITVPAVEFVDPDAARSKRINLDISYDLAGEMRRNGTCNFTDMRASGAMSTVAVRHQVGQRNVEEEAPIPLTFEEFKRYQSAPPARTPYYMSVQVDGDRTGEAWNRIPQISSLSVNLRIVQ